MNVPFPDPIIAILFHSSIPHTHTSNKRNAVSQFVVMYSLRKQRGEEQENRRKAEFASEIRGNVMGVSKLDTKVVKRQGERGMMMQPAGFEYAEESHWSAEVNPVTPLFFLGFVSFQ